MGMVLVVKGSGCPNNKLQCENRTKLSAESAVVIGAVWKFIMKTPKSGLEVGSSDPLHCTQKY
eukprot:3547318-Amphidinium_carterae.1